MITITKIEQALN